MKKPNGKRAIAAILVKEPRGFHKGAMLAGAKPITESHRRLIIASRAKLRAELDTPASESRL